MSGVIGQTSLSIDLQDLDGSAGNYRLVSFPERVRVTSVGFTVNDECMGIYEDNRVWKIYCMIGHQAPTEESPWNTWSTPIFGLNDKPTVTRDRIYTSSYMTNQVSAVAKPNGGIETIDLDYGVLAPGDFLSMWVQSESGDFDEITWANTAANITLTYEPTNAKTAYEWIQIYPSLD